MKITDDPPQITQHTVQELYPKHKNWLKIFENKRQNIIPCLPGTMFEQRERAIGTLTAGMSAKDIVRHFQRHESTISQLLKQHAQTSSLHILQGIIILVYTNLVIRQPTPHVYLTLSQTSPGFYVSAVQVIRKPCGKRRNCS